MRSPTALADRRRVGRRRDAASAADVCARRSLQATDGGDGGGHDRLEQERYRPRFYRDCYDCVSVDDGRGGGGDDGDHRSTGASAPWTMRAPAALLPDLADYS